LMSLVDVIQMLRSSPFRPGKEITNIRFGHCFVNTNNPKRPIINIKLPKTKTSKKRKRYIINRVILFLLNLHL